MSSRHKNGIVAEVKTAEKSTEGSRKSTKNAKSKNEYTGVVGVEYSNGEGEIRYRTHDGRVLDGSDVKFDGGFESSIIEYAAETHQTDTANSMISGMNYYRDYVESHGEGVNAREYREAFDALYEIGNTGISYDAVSRSVRDSRYISVIGPQAARLAVESGQREYFTEQKQKSTSAKSDTKSTSTKGNTESSAKEKSDTKSTKKSSNGKKYSIRYTTDSRPVVVIEEDILEGVKKENWINVVKKAIKNKFANGIPIRGRLIKVNSISRREFTGSKNSKYIRANDGTVYADKMRTANNLDEIILASTNYVNEDLNHSRKDNIKEFARGDVLIKVGDNEYSAKVIIGFTGSSMLLYDIIDFKHADFTIEKEDTSVAGYAKNAGSLRIDVSSDTNIPQGISESQDNSMQNSKKIYPKAGEVQIAEGASAKVSRGTLMILKEIAKLGKVGIVIESFGDSKANGYHQNRVIHINADKASVAYGYYAIHEAVHHIRQNNAEGYEVLEKFVVGYLKSRGVDIDGRLDEIKELYELNGEVLEDDKAAIEELVCNTVSGITSDEDALAAFMNLSEKEQHTLMDVLRRLSNRIRNFAKRLNNAETDVFLDDAKALKELAEKFRAALEGVNENSGGNTKEGYKSSLEEDSNGDKVVVINTDQGIFINVPKSDYSKIAREYFNEHFKGAVLPVGNYGDVVEMSKSLPGEYTYPHTRLDNKSKEYSAKMKAITELDNILLTAKNHHFSEDTKGHKEAELGWDYYEVEFICDGMQVQGLINIENSESGRYFYDITKIKVAPAISEKYVALMARLQSTSQVATNDNIARSRDIVNNNSMQERKKYAFSEEDLHKVEEYFGTTYRIKEAGYILTNGKMLDMSGRHDGAPGGYRTVDHRDVSDAIDEYETESYSGAMVDFMQAGNIRISPESGGINLSVNPNEMQEKTLKRYISAFSGEVMLDIDNEYGDTVASVEYPRGTSSDMILLDIRDYFKKGLKPSNNIRYSLEDTEKAMRQVIKRSAYNEKQAEELCELLLPYASVYTDNVTGDATVGEKVVFAEAIFTGSYKNPKFSHFEVVEGEIIKDSYGSDKQQHTFTLKLKDGTRKRIKGRNLYKYGTFAQPRDSAQRAQARSEKHSRGDIARAIRDERRENQRKYAFEGLTEDEYVDYIMNTKNNPLSIRERATTRNPSSIGWVYRAEIFSWIENKKFHQKISEIRSGSNAFMKNKDGEYMLPIENKIVFTDGNFDSPYISSIVEVLELDTTDYEDYMEAILLEGQGKLSHREATRYNENFTRKGCAVEYKAGTFGVFAWEDGKRKGKNRREVIQDYLRERYRRGDAEESTGDLRGGVKKYSFEGEELDFDDLYTPTDEDERKAREKELKLLSDHNEVVTRILYNTKDVNLTDKEFGKVIRRVLRQYTDVPASGFDTKSELTTRATDRITELLRHGDRLEISGQDLVGELAVTVKALLNDNVYVTDLYREEREEAVSMMQDISKGKRIYLTDGQIETLKENGYSLMWLRRKLYGKLNITRKSPFATANEKSLSEVYETLHSEMPHHFKTWENGGIDEDTLPLELVKSLDRLKPSYISADEMFVNVDEMSIGIASELVGEVLDAKYNKMLGYAENSAQAAKQSYKKEKEAYKALRQNLKNTLNRWKRSKETALRMQRLESMVLSLYRRATKPTHQNHIPEMLREPVTGLLESLDFIKGRYNRRTGTYDVGGEGTPTRHDSIWQVRMLEFAKKLEQYQRASADGTETNGIFVTSSVNQRLIDDINRFAEECTTQRVYDMSDEEAARLFDIMTRIIHEINEADTLHDNAISRRVSKLGNDTVDELNDIGVRKSLKMKASRWTYFDTANPITMS